MGGRGGGPLSRGGKGSGKLPGGGGGSLASTEDFGFKICGNWNFFLPGIWKEFYF